MLSLAETAELRQHQAEDASASTTARTRYDVTNASILEQLLLAQLGLHLPVAGHADPFSDVTAGTVDPRPAIDAVDGGQRAEHQHAEREDHEHSHRHHLVRSVTAYIIHSGYSLSLGTLW